LDSLNAENLFLLAFSLSKPQPELLVLAMQKGGVLKDYIYYEGLSYVNYLKYKDILLDSNIYGEELVKLACYTQEMNPVSRRELLDLAKERGVDFNKMVHCFKNSNIFLEVKDYLYDKVSGNDLILFYASVLVTFPEAITKEILEKGLTKGGNIALALSDEIINNHPKLRDEYLNKITDYNEAMDLALAYGITELVRYLSNELGIKVDAPIIGITNQGGEWTPNVMNSIGAGSKINQLYALYIGTKHVNDEKFLSIFSGFVNPGAVDSYPQNMREFSLTDMDPESMLDLEKSYQKIIKHAIQNDKPYIGFCAGNQHLALYKGGKLKPVQGYGSDDHKAHFETGSIPYFYALTAPEQHALVKNCIMPNVIAHNIHTAHSYAVVNDVKGTGLQIGALSEEGVVQSIAVSIKQIGFQFHPEDHYDQASAYELNREKNILDNYFKMVVQYHSANSYAKANSIPYEQIQEKLKYAEAWVVNRLNECMSKPISPKLESVFITTQFDNYQCPVEGNSVLDIFNNHYWE
jgi:gamma-glutamyl-gamma-aminobutyrate hydrolase PuuD